nr:MAG TPA: hypothetical protein [Caudoviricetes sp.]
MSKNVCNIRSNFLPLQVALVLLRVQRYSKYLSSPNKMIGK